ncbi:MAG: mechanosensitive ion channel family protein [Bacteroidota bacterium]
MDLLHRTFLGNTLESYLWFAGILTAGLLFKRFISRLISAWLFRFIRKKEYEVGVNEFIGLVSAPVQFLIMVILLYFACDRLSFPTEWKLVSEEKFGVRFVLDHLYRGLMVVAITWIVLRLVDFFGLVLVARAKRSMSKSDDQLVPFLKEGVKVLLAGVGFLIMLGVAFELDIVSLVTGLGIGGLAFALAAKETLENLLGSFAIFMDKPFFVGDTVRVGAIEGVVESIGFRSTRIRSVDKSLVILPNKKMVDAELVNESEREMRRIRTVLLLRHGTASEQLQALTADLADFLQHRPFIEGEPQIHLRGFTPAGQELAISAIFRIPDADLFSNELQAFNLRVLELMKKYEIQWANPTASVAGIAV